LNCGVNATRHWLRDDGGGGKVDHGKVASGLQHELFLLKARKKKYTALKSKYIFLAKGASKVSDLLNKAFNTVDVALMEKGKITNDDVPPELITYLRMGLLTRLYDDSRFRVGQGFFPVPLPDYFEDARVQNGRITIPGMIDLEIPREDFDAGDIPEVEYEDNPFLDVGPYSTRRKLRAEEEFKSIYSNAPDPYAEGRPTVRKSK